MLSSIHPLSLQSSMHSKDVFYKAIKPNNKEKEEEESLITADNSIISASLYLFPNRKQIHKISKNAKRPNTIGKKNLKFPNFF